MEIHVKPAEPVTIVELSGDIDGRTAPEARAQVSALIQPNCKILLDMSRVGYMSSAGLRVLLATYRQVSSNDGQIVLVGLSDEIADTMSMTGFLRFFSVYDTVDAGMAALE
jgi:anti-sigma B factor antagonist